VRQHSCDKLQADLHSFEESHRESFPRDAAASAFEGAADNKHSVAVDKLSDCSLDRAAEHSDSFDWETVVAHHCYCCQSYSMVDNQKQGSVEKRVSA